MNQRIEEQKQAEARVPRAGGDEPGLPVRTRSVAACSPRGRG